MIFWSSLSFKLFQLFQLLSTNMKTYLGGCSQLSQILDTTLRSFRSNIAILALSDDLRGGGNRQLRTDWYWHFLERRLHSDGLNVFSLLFNIQVVKSVPASRGKTSAKTKLFVISILAAISLSVSMKLMLCQWCQWSLQYSYKISNSLLSLLLGSQVHT